MHGKTIKKNGTVIVWNTNNIMKNRFSRPTTVLLGGDWNIWWNRFLRGASLLHSNAIQSEIPAWQTAAAVYYSKLHMFVTFQSSGVIISRKKGWVGYKLATFQSAGVIISRRRGWAECKWRPWEYEKCVPKLFGNNRKISQVNSMALLKIGTNDSVRWQQFVNS
jgi:hypothetical protein